MEPTQGIVPPLTDELHAARLAYLAACDAAAAITKEHGELRLQVGGNETERRAAQKRATQEEYDGWLIQFTMLDVSKTEAIMWRDRCEKDLNTLRDLFNRETAELQRATADRCTEIAHLERVTSARNADTTDRNIEALRLNNETVKLNAEAARMTYEAIVLQAEIAKMDRETAQLTSAIVDADAARHGTRTTGAEMRGRYPVPASVDDSEVPF